MKKTDSETIKIELSKLANPEKAAFFPRFFKAGKGEYAEGDKFIGVTVPNQRLVAKKYIDLPLDQVKELLESPYHEHRLTGLLILVYKFEKSEDTKQNEIYNFYLANTDSVNNWDLVDSSAKIVGDYLLNKDKSILKKLADSKNMWEQRISIVSTLSFISRNDFEYTKLISIKLLDHEHDLIHKAVGWMLREMGKKDETELIEFLDNYVTKMHRTTLRYSIERLSPADKKHYMNL